MKWPKSNERLKFALLVLGLLFVMAVFGAAVWWLITPANAAGIAPPCPIALKLHTVPDGLAAGFHVNLLDAQGIPILQSVSNEYSEVFFELSGVADCTPHMAVVIECDNNPACTQLVSFNPTGLTDWYLSFAPVTTTVPPETTTTTTLPCPTCDTCDECPVQDLTQIIAVAGGLFAVIGYLINYLIQRWNVSKGKVRVQAYLPYTTPAGKASFHWVTKYESTKDKTGKIIVKEK